MCYTKTTPRNNMEWSHGVIISTFNAMKAQSLKWTANIQLRDLQIKSILAILQKKDLICILPTGGGKTLCMILPAILDSFAQDNARRVTLIVSPLDALMDDMTKHISAIGYFVVAYKGNAVHGFENDIKKFPLSGPLFVLMSPEALLSVKNSVEFYESLGIFHVCIDEGHCITQWGEVQENGEPAFREKYSKLYKVRCQTQAMFGVYTATMTKMMIALVIQRTCLVVQNLVQVIEIPDRKNLYLHLHGATKNMETCLLEIISELKNKKLGMAKTLIFVNSAKEADEVYRWIRRFLGDQFLTKVPSGNMERLVGMFTAPSGPNTKRAMAERFSSSESSMRIMVATIAYGMGIDIPNIRNIVIWGMPSNVVTLWQEIGRCSRDGNPGTIHIHNFACRTSRSRGCKIQLDANSCIRAQILSFFVIAENKDISSQDKTSSKETQSLQCCSFCNSQEQIHKQ